MARSSLQDGFSYLWTLMFIGLLSSTFLVTAELHSVAARRDRERQLLFIGKEFREAIRSYYEFGASGTKQYPQSLEDLLKDPRSLKVVRHLRRLYPDPISGESEWGLIRVGGRIVGIHSLSNMEPLKQGGFDPDDTAFSDTTRYSEWIFAYLPEQAAQRPTDAEAAFVRSDRR